MPTLRSNVVVQSGSAGAAPAVSAWVNMFADVNMMQLVAYNSLLVFPLCAGVFPGAMTANTLALHLSASNSTGSSSHSSTVRVGIYTMAATDQLSLLNSASSTWSAAAGTTNSRLYFGARELTLHSSQWSSPPAFGQSQYWVGVIFQSSNFANGAQLRGAAVFNQTYGGTFGVSNSVTTVRPYPGLGVYSASTTAFPSAVSLSQLLFNVPFANGIPLVALKNTGQ